MKILKMFNDWTQSEVKKRKNSYGGCGYYRTIKVAQQLTPEHDVTVWGKEWHDKYEEYKRKYKNPGLVNEYFFSHVFSSYDMIWLHFINNPVMFAWMRVAATKYGCKLVMDIDDNFLELNDNSHAKDAIGTGQWKLKKGKATPSKGTQTAAELSAMLSCCDALTVSTVPLKEKLESHLKEVHGKCPPIFVIPNANDVNNWNYTPALKKDHVVIGYSGGISHVDDLDLVLPALKEVMTKYPTVELQILGQMTFADSQDVFGEWPQDIRNRIILVSPTDTQPEYPAHLASMQWDIGIAPLVDTPFNKCKSHIKWMEYSMYKIPTVASKVYPYYKDVLGRSVISSGDTGMLCEKDDWVDVLSKLIEDESLRLTAGINAHQDVLANWQYKDLKPYILEKINEISAL